MATLRATIDGKTRRVTVVPVVIKYGKRRAKILIGRSVRPHTFRTWQSGQGGIKRKEHKNPLKAAYRELKEEFGIPKRRLLPIAAAVRFPTFSFPSPNPHPVYDGEVLVVQAFLLRPGVKPEPVGRKGTAEEFDKSKYIKPRKSLELCARHKTQAYAQMIEDLAPVFEAVKSLEGKKAKKKKNKKKAFKAAWREVIGHEAVLAACAGNILTRNFSRMPTVLLNAPQR